MVTTRLHFRRQIAFFRTQHISGLLRMAEQGQVDGVIGQLDTNQLAAARQHHIIGGIEVIDRHIAKRTGSVALFQFAAVKSRADKEKEAAAKGMCRAQQVTRIHDFVAAFHPDAEKTAHDYPLELVYTMGIDVHWDRFGSNRMKPYLPIFCLILAAGPALAQAPAATQPVPAPGSVKTTTQTVTVPAAPVTAPKPPTAPVAAVAAPVKPVVEAPAMTAPTSPVLANGTSLSPSASLADQFKGQLPFVLDELKMIAFAEASRRVKKINDKWDVQIAAAETDQRAIEYNNFAVEEITKSLDNIPGLTLDQYNAMTKLTATNPDFNRVYLAYLDLLKEGKVKAPAAPVAATTATPAAKPAGSGTAPAPQGSPKPPYSQPASRQ